MQNFSDRFTATIENYLHYRPSYPKEVLQLAIDRCNLKKDDIIADIGSGTGFLSKLFLEHGNSVFGVEPNEAMRHAAQQYLKSYAHFHNIDGNAENTTLKNHSIDFITAGTSFHWFDATKAKIEFQRILRSQGWVLLVWNVRDIKHSKLVNEYENLILKFGKDYKNSRAQEFDKTAVSDFFAPNHMHTASFKNTQLFNWEGFKGRLLSASYSLREGESGYEDMLKALHLIFDHYQQNNMIEFLYETKVFYGQIHN